MRARSSLKKSPASNDLDLPRKRWTSRAYASLAKICPQVAGNASTLLSVTVLPCYVAFPPDISYAKLRVATLSRIDLKEGASVTPVVTSFKLLHKFAGLSWRDRALLFEAAAALVLSSSLVALVPFKFTTRLAKLPNPRITPHNDERAIIRRRVRWALLACARRANWRAVCFQQGLAAQWMLRRRGVPSVLYYGVAHDAEGGLAAHVWV